MSAVQTKTHEEGLAQLYLATNLTVCFYGVWKNNIHYSSIEDGVWDSLIECNCVGWCYSCLGKNRQLTLHLNICYLSEMQKSFVRQKE